ncbi:unnamed protein product [Spirodela intermedia]|uniref:Uncharacterized protein n=1 Tax=Spirodela intermedia TaxID=51605 RepID=A0ABN7EBK5_SPIIN|nr:unnamed protein product [Spirodela intermedia]
MEGVRHHSYYFTWRSRDCPHHLCSRRAFEAIDTTRRSSRMLRILVHHRSITVTTFGYKRIQTCSRPFSHMYDHSLPHSWLATSDVEGEW